MIPIPHMSKEELNFGCYGEVTDQLFFFSHIPIIYSRDVVLSNNFIWNTKIVFHVMGFDTKPQNYFKVSM